MIEDADPDQLSHLAQPPRDAEIFLARFGVAARVVVDQDDAGSRVQDGGSEHLARVDDRRVQASDRTPRTAM